MINEYSKMYFTHIGDYSEIQAHHYIAVVFDLKSRSIKYCDSLGWKCPPDFLNFTNAISLQFFGGESFQLTCAHIPSNETNSGVHLCLESGCCSHYPLQKDGKYVGYHK